MAGTVFAVVANSDVLLAPSSMKVAKTIFADGWRSALSAVDLDVLAAVNAGMVAHRDTLPLGFDILES